MASFFVPPFPMQVEDGVGEGVFGRVKQKTGELLLIWVEGLQVGPANFEAVEGSFGRTQDCLFAFVKITTSHHI